MTHNNIINTPDRNVWRAWLEEHFETESEAWLVYPLKASGEKSIEYNDAVEEALCFGWIDSIRKRLDDTHQIQRFTPRRKGSPYSQPNIERLIWLESQRMIHPKVLPSVKELICTPFHYPDDIIKAIKADGSAWDNYCKMSEPYKRIRVAYIDAARKRPDEFARRLKSFIEKTRKGLIIAGFGGVEKYYK